MKSTTTLLILYLLALGPVTAHAVAIYDFNGTCETDCPVVGLNVGDAVTGSISFGFVDLNFGTFTNLDTQNPLADGVSISATVTGTQITALTISDPGSANLYLMPGAATANAWELSLSSGFLPNGAGTWDEAGVVDGAMTYALNGATCQDFSGGDCADIGLNVDDSVSGTISLGFIDLDIGTFSLLDSDNPIADGFTINATVVGNQLTELQIFDAGSANAYLFPGLSSGDAWELSLSSGGLPSGNGTWTLRDAVAPEPTTLTLFGLGLAGLGFIRKKKA